MSTPMAWWHCACGWRGGPDDLRVGDDGNKTCPARPCGASGGLEVYTLCPYCNALADCVTDPAGAFSGERMIWRCEPCDARVGCHAGTCSPLGTLANAELRMVRRELHRRFDPIWEDAVARGTYKSVARRYAYRWLAALLQLTEAETHIGMFNEARAGRALELIVGKTWDDVLAWREGRPKRQTFESVGDYPEPPEDRYDLSDNVR